MPREMKKIGLLCLPLAMGLLFLAEPAMAQAFRHPFAVGAQEGAVGQVSGLSAWIIEKESAFYLLLSHALTAAKQSGTALIGLVGIGFGYGVFHAAGPGHGKAVITSYMVSNERALRRGIVISALAALLQALIAIVLIGCAALIFNATAQKMTEAAHILELAAYCGIVLLGLALIWRKGSALVATVRGMLAETARSWSMQSLAMEPPVLRVFANAPEPNGNLSQRSAFRATDAQAASTEAGDDCGPQCAHLIDPNQFSNGFSWKSAAVTIVTAGARPCSGAILVLVFSLAQGIFPIGIAAVFAMALGTAVTTATLALMAVYGKKLAVRLAGRRQSSRALLIGQVIEVGAAVCVLLFGSALLLASLTGMMISA
ncbi:MAG: nickel/cobalt transporter [Methylovirgula sp.]